MGQELAGWTLVLLGLAAVGFAVIGDMTMNLFGGSVAVTTIFSLYGLLLGWLGVGIHQELIMFEQGKERRVQGLILVFAVIIGLLMGLRFAFYLMP